jgi:adenine deaminase
MKTKKIYANLVHIEQQTIHPSCIEIENGKIINIYSVDESFDSYILCGFVDAHIHIESSMMPPSEFARVALTHGTIGAVTDPHEIANVLGIKGIEFMIESGKKAPFYFSNGLPSCVPATSFETAGAEIGVNESEQLLPRDEITHLSEVMNIPAVLNNDPEIFTKIALAKKHHKPIDGHAPLLRGEELTQYINSGITTDHEAISYDEAKEKIEKGMKIQIREGSSAKNFEALYPLIDEYPNSCMFCSDDLHPNDLITGHINLLVKRAVQKGMNLWNVLKCASINPRKHYNLESGTLNIGDWADFIEVDNLKDFNVLKTYIKGEIVASNGESLIPFQKEQPINNFHAKVISSVQLQVKNHNRDIRVIKAMDGELITKELWETPRVKNGLIVSDTTRDILKIVVVNRYTKEAKISIDFIEGFGFKKGAIASSIAHDSHNIIAVGVSDTELTEAINLLIENRGGISAIYEENKEILPLEIAGLMSQQEGKEIAKIYSKLDTIVKDKMGSTLKAPYMTLSFMALLVIPELKLSDKGLFDGRAFHFVSRYRGEK